MTTTMFRHALPPFALSHSYDVLTRFPFLPLPALFYLFCLWFPLEICFASVSSKFWTSAQVFKTNLHVKKTHRKFKIHDALFHLLATQQFPPKSFQPKSFQPEDFTSRVFNPRAKHNWVGIREDIPRRGSYKRNKPLDPSLRNFGS